MTAAGRTDRRGRWLLVLALVIGVVGMHHLVGSHHGVPAVRSAEATAATAAPAMPHGAHAPTGGDAAHPDGSGPAGMSMVLHLCLAVLAAGVLALLGAASSAVLAVAARPSPTVAAPRAGPLTARLHPPPVPVRLAWLQILRR